MVATQKDYKCQIMCSTEVSFLFSGHFKEKEITTSVSVIILAYRSGDSIRDFNKPNL